jgi:hypothetical protein
MNQNSGSRSRHPSRLRQVSILLMVVAVIIIGSDIAYLLINLSSGNTSTSPPTQPGKSTLSPADLYTSVTSKTSFLNDALDGTHSANWGTYTNNQNGYAFRNGALHGFMAVIDPLANPQAPLTRLVECSLLNETFSNFAFQVHITILQGDQTFVGLFFRADQQVTRTYRFYADFYGDYNFTTEQDAEPVGTNLSVFQPGLQTQKSLTITVIAQNTSFYLYLNKNYLREVTDSSYNAGEIGFFVTRSNAAATDVAFSQAEVWKL